MSKETITLTRDLFDEMLQAAADKERHRIITAIENYYGLTRYSVEVEKATDSPHWNAGYQAALSIAKGQSNE